MDDFTSDVIFLMGMAAPDNDGRMGPVASVGFTVNSASYKQSLTRFVKFEAPRNARFNMEPHAEYYVATFATAAGITIDFKEESAKAGPVDFTSHSGMYGAVVTCNDSGDFNVKYAVSRSEYLDSVDKHKEGESTLEQKVGKLEKQLYVSHPNFHIRLAR